MLSKTIIWYRALHPAWKVVAWVVIVLALVAAVFERLMKVVGWIGEIGDRAVVDNSARTIAEARGKVRVLEDEIERLREHERGLGERDDELSKKIEELDANLVEAKQRVKEQTDDEQGSFFDRRYRR